MPKSNSCQIIQKMNRTKEWTKLSFCSSSDEDEVSGYFKFFSGVSSGDTTDESAEEEGHVPLIKDFMETVDAYNYADFKSHFKLNRSTVEELHVNYSQSNFTPASKQGGRPKIGARKEVYMYVWYICNTISFKQLADLFGVSKSSAWTAVGRVSSWLVSKGGEYVRWPQGELVRQNSRKFEGKKGIPGILGVIDCTHIKISAPKEDKNVYYNRKHSYTLAVQAVVDAEKKFIDISCGEPGSLHDSSVLRLSNLFKRVETHFSYLFPFDTYLLGDAAYPSLQWLMPPYEDHENMSEQQRAFNCMHSATRIVIKDTFGLLKGRFRRLLRFTEQRDLDSIRKLILSAFILHNICLIDGDKYDDFLYDEDAELPLGTTKESDIPDAKMSVQRREVIFNYLCERNML